MYLAESTDIWITCLRTTKLGKWKSESPINIAITACFLALDHSKFNPRGITLAVTKRDIFLGKS